MTCRLCEKDLELKASHIVPEAFWRSLYNSKHQALPITAGQKKLSPVQKGIREKLLCEGCEGKLSRWEGALKLDLADMGNLHSNFLDISRINSDLIRVSNIRYERFKLAVLSILWRMSISKNPLYSSYRLGPYENIIRNILHKEKSVSEIQFPVFVSRYELDGVFRPDIMMGFPPGRYQRKFTIQHFSVWGHLISIVVTNKDVHDVPLNLVLRESGEIFVDVRSLVEIASPDNVTARLFDKDVKEFYGE